MPLDACLLVVATLLPLASFVVLVFAGRRMGTPLSGIFATLAIGGSFVCSIIAMMNWLNPPSGQPWGAQRSPITITLPWVPGGTGIAQSQPGYLDVGIYVDSLTIAMFSMVTAVALLVHIFSLAYMAEDKRYPRFFTYLGLFCFSMLGLVLGATILHLFIFWELVGLCSYLLIGFWYEKKSASNAAIKAFVVNRIGDFGFLIGFGILFYHLGNVTLPQVWVALGRAGTMHPGDIVTLAGGSTITYTLLTVMGIGLFFGAVGKSAQFPLHVWLPDAMEGPTPVSALIHAATMVAAGVYLVGRIFPILTPDARLFIAIIGCITLTMAALIAIAQSDIKKVLAFSTLSQLGYMILAMGIGSWVGGLFHLITHAFFKSLLFLGSGSVIHAAHHEQEMPQYGGLLRKIPVTAFTFGIAVLAIAGTPFLSAYYSKDMILAHAGAFSVLAHEGHRSGFFWLLFALPALIAYVTAFYMMRCWMLTFWGKPRNKHLHDHAHETPMLYIPLVVLAVFSIIAGKYMGVKDLLVYAQQETTRICQSTSGDPTFDPFASAWKVELTASDRGGDAADADHADSLLPVSSAEQERAATVAGIEAESSPEGQGEQLVSYWVFWAFAIGIGLGFVLYMNGYAIADKLMLIPPLAWIHTWLKNRMYFDELYRGVFMAAVFAASWLAGTFDRVVVDGVVNLVARSVRQLSGMAGLFDKYVVDGTVTLVGSMAEGIGSAARIPQTGRIRLYVMLLLSCVVAGMAVAITLVAMH